MERFINRVNLRFNKNYISYRVSYGDSAAMMINYNLIISVTGFADVINFIVYSLLLKYTEPFYSTFSTTLKQTKSVQHLFNGVELTE